MEGACEHCIAALCENLRTVAAHGVDRRGYPRPRQGFLEALDRYSSFNFELQIGGGAIKYLFSSEVLTEAA